MRGELQESIGHLVVTEEETSGTDAGTFTSGAWRTRDLNTTEVNTMGAIVGLLPQITLRAGIYEVRASAPAIGVEAHQARLYDVTNAAVLLTGTSEMAPSVLSDHGGVTTRSFVLGRIYLTADTAIRLEHRCEKTIVNEGMGYAIGWTDEIYALLEIHKVA